MASVCVCVHSPYIISTLLMAIKLRRCPRCRTGRFCVWMCRTNAGAHIHIYMRTAAVRHVWYVYTQSPGVLWAQPNRVVVGRASSSAPAAARARSSLIRGVNQGYRESRTLYSRALCALPLARARARAHDGAQCWCWWCDGGCCSACMRVCRIQCAMRMRGAHGFFVCVRLLGQREASPTR